MDPSDVLNSLKESYPNESYQKNSKRLHNFLYSSNNLVNLANSLLNPPLTEINKVKRVKNEKVLKLKHSKLTLDLEFLTKVCTDTKFFITPSEDGLEYLRESLELFESCLLCIPNFKLKEDDSSDVESHFKNLLESFFLYLENENFQVELDDKDLEELSSSDLKNLTKVDFQNKDDYPLITQMFIAVVLAYNWSLKLFNYTEIAMEISKSNLKDYDNEKVLKTALGLKEANRNYVFYTNVSQQVWDLLKDKDSSANSFIAEFMERIAFVDSIANSEMSYQPHYWNRLKLTMEKPETQIFLFPLKNEHEENLNMIRNEMAKRVSGKTKCEYLRKELEKVNSELAQMEAKSDEVLTKLDSLRKQLKDLSGTFKTDTLSFGKSDELKKLPKTLYNLVTHLSNYTQSNLLRDVSYKLSKEYNYSFHMVLSAPKDLLFPSLEATKFVFPVVLHFYLEGEEVKVKQIGNPKLSTSKSSVELVMNKFLGVDQDQELDFGLQEFKNQLPEGFYEKMEGLYKLAQEFVWNLYVLESYKSNNKLILSKILPTELQERNVQSKYTFKEKNIWTLSNDSASVVVKVVVVENKFQFEFSEFKKKGNLEVVEGSKLYEYVKKKNELSVEKLNELSPTFFEYFKSGDDLIHLSILFESYSVIFDFLST